MTYDPINLPDELVRNGLEVWFRATIRNDLGGFHMAGTIVGLEQIGRP